MDENKCQYCGNELNSKRAKNCPTCSQLSNEAYKVGGYDLAIQAVTEAKVAGLTSAEIHQTWRDAIQAGKARSNQWYLEHRQRMIERRERDHQQIEFYNEHGYWPGQENSDGYQADEPQPVARGTMYSDQAHLDTEGE